MIPRETIDKIVETARIEEVVGDFVHLKKRGVSLIGLCPFHNEKTPSFNVSVNKGIYKCFGCGKGGDAVQFVIEHEKYSYPEALKYLAKKYNIEIEEAESSPEQAIADSKRESLFIISEWAGKFFQQSMWDTDEGKTVGLSYFRERGFRDDIIKKFELGYSPDEWDALIQKAKSESYQEEFLEESGLAIRNDKEKLYDRFRGRAMFPIHNLTGKIIGFGGRTLRNDKNIPKYVNSPESEIYHKSNVLYGLHLAKKAIRDEDNCFLVEGYADVLSVHQAGVENVVASSGTSLTIEQVRMIGRFAKNISILYDGDEAGIKATLRGLDMILEEGLNVKIVLFNDGHDPDSFVQKFGSAAFKTYIKDNQQEFVVYKTNYLLREAKDNPISRAEMFGEIAQTIALIKDALKRAEYIRETSSLFKLEERAFLNSVNQIIRQKSKKIDEKLLRANELLRENVPLERDDLTDSLESLANPCESQEKEIIRLLLTYGHELVNWDNITDTYIAPYVIANLADVTFDHPVCRKIIEAYKTGFELGHLPSEQDFIRDADAAVSQLAISLVSSPYILSENWYARRKIFVHNEKENLQKTIKGGIFHLKKRKVDHILGTIREELQHEHDADNQAILMQRYLRVKEVEKGISDFLGSVIMK